MDRVKPTSGWKVIWVRESSESMALYELLGARPVQLTSAEMSDPKKRTSRIGGLRHSPDGRIKLGDVYAYEIPADVKQQRTDEAAAKARARIERLKDGGDAAPYLAKTPHYRSRKSADIPDDGDK
jgi:hypothetical protein